MEEQDKGVLVFGCARGAGDAAADGGGGKDPQRRQRTTGTWVVSGCGAPRGANDEARFDSMRGPRSASRAWLAGPQ